MPRTLADLLPASRIGWLDTKSKDEALQALLGLISGASGVSDPDALRQAIFSREVKMSTGIGYGVALPHAKIRSVRSWVLAMGICPNGLPYPSALDDLPVKLLVMIAGPEEDQDGYITLLANLVRFIKSEKGKIISSTSADEIHRFAREYPLVGPGA